jgi:hypothetical protein
MDLELILILCVGPSYVNREVIVFVLLHIWCGLYIRDRILLTYDSVVRKIFLLYCMGY